MISRIGILGDIHGQVHNLAVALDFLLNEAPDAILCTGDLPIKNSTHSLETAEKVNICVRLLRHVNISAVRGNHDRYFVESAADTLLADLFPEEWEASREALDFLRTLPTVRQFETPRGKLLLCHGVGRKDTAGIYPGGENAAIVQTLKEHDILQDGVAVLVMGHTHRAMCRTVAGVILINPGTLLPEAEAPGFALADLAGGAVQFYAIRSGRVTADARYELGAPGE